VGSLQNKTISTLRLPRQDLLAASLLLTVLACWCLGAFALGLEYTPDSGLYLYAGVRGYRETLLDATQSNYAPGFPWLISAALIFCDLPGNAATVVQAASLAVIVLGAYQLMRGTGTTCWLSCTLALLVGFYRSNSYVFSMHMSEGPLSALLVLLVVVAHPSLTSASSRSRLCAIGLASLVPLIKYGAGMVPIASVVSLATLADSAPWRRRRRIQFSIELFLAVLPVAAYFGWNHIREGALSAHPRARMGLVDNALSAITTLCHAFTGWLGIFLALALVAAWAARKEGPRATGERPARTALFASVLALAYFAGLIAGASVVLVDRLVARLCAPGVTLLVLALALWMTSSLRALSRTAPQRAKYLIFAGAMVALAALAIPMQKSLAEPMRLLISGKRTTVESTHERGFRRSAGALGLQRFYESELAHTPHLSATFVEAKPSPGSVRRGWLAMAGVLGNAPGHLQGFGALQLDSVSDTSVLFRWGTAHSILFLSADLPESRRLPEHVPLPTFVMETVARVLRAGRAANRAEHWILVPKQAAWFVPEGDLLGGAQVLHERDAGSYRAFLVRT
jgi:hypothetical protein